MLLYLIERVNVRYIFTTGDSWWTVEWVLMRFSSQKWPKLNSGSIIYVTVDTSRRVFGHLTASTLLGGLLVLIKTSVNIKIWTYHISVVVKWCNGPQRIYTSSVCLQSKHHSGDLEFHFHVFKLKLLFYCQTDATFWRKFIKINIKMCWWFLNYEWFFFWTSHAVVRWASSGVEVEIRACSCFLSPVNPLFSLWSAWMAPLFTPIKSCFF